MTDLIKSPDSDAASDPAAPETVLDMEAIEQQRVAGIQALDRLYRSHDRVWKEWEHVIRGLGALRDLATAQAGNSNLRSQAYRDAISYQLSLPQNAAYARLSNQTRSSCYRLVDHLDELCTWLAGKEIEDQLEWNHPNTVAKNCPPEFLSGGLRGHNQPPRKRAKDAKPSWSEIQHLQRELDKFKALLLKVIGRLIKHEPEAVALLDQIASSQRPAELDDDLNDI
jgi:hypothetical protein